MFDIILYEFKKIWLKKSLVIFLLLLSLANMGIFIYEQYVSSIYPPSTYRALEEQLQAIPNNQRYDFINEQYQRFNAFYQLERLAALRLDQAKNKYQIDTILEQYPDLEKEYALSYKQDHLPKYTSTLESEVQFLKSIKEEFTTLHQYPEYIATIQQKAKTISSISVFQSSIKKEQKNIEKTAKDYQGLSDIVITYESEKGITSIVSFNITSFLIILGMMVLTTTMILEEKEKNLFSIIKITPNGQYPTLLAKCLVMTITVLLLTIVMVLGQVVSASILYGIGDVTRSIQSLASFLHCFYDINVWQFLLCFILVKWLAASVLGFVILLISLVLNNKMLVMLVTLIIVIIEYMLYVCIPPLSTFYLFKYINIISILQTDSFFQIYRNVQLFHHLVSLQTIIVSTLIIGMITLIIVNTLIYHYKQNMSIQPIKLPFPIYRRPPNASLLWQELYKMLSLQKVMVILVVSLGMQYYQYQNMHIYLDSNTKLYQQYMQKLEGPLTTDKEQFLLNEQVHYQELEEQLLNISKKHEEGLITKSQATQMQSQIEQQMLGKEVFQEIFQQYQEIKEHPQRQFVLPYAYTQYFIETSRTFLPTVLLCISCLIAFSNIFCYEYQNQMHKITQATILGNHHILWIKYALSLCIGLLLFVISMLPTLLLLQQTYGFSSWFASITSIAQLTNLPETMTIATGCIISILLKLFSITVMITCIHAIGVKTRNQILTLFISVCVFLFPLLLTMGGFHLLDNFSLYPLLFVGQYITGDKIQILLSFIGYGVMLIYALKTLLKDYQPHI